MLFVAERWRHHALGGMIPVLVLVLTGIEQQMLDQRLAIDALSRCASPSAIASCASRQLVCTM
ncbi:hypothetical protein BRDID11002_61940 [Bradyrhizobium diazoefficiens]